MPHGTRRKNLDGIAGCLGHHGAHPVIAGFTNQTEYLARQSCFPYWLDQTNRHLGHFAKHSNGLLSRFRPHSIVRHRLPGLPGRGALVAEIGRSHGSLAIFVLHLALGRATRLRQMGYLAELVNEFEQVIFTAPTPAGDRAGVSTIYW